MFQWENCGADWATQMQVLVKERNGKNQRPTPDVGVLTNYSSEFG